MRVKYRTDQDVTSVRVAGDDRENQHRIQEEQTRQVRLLLALCN
jgi:dynein regulatory complex protein 1